MGQSPAKSRNTMTLPELLPSDGKRPVSSVHCYPATLFLHFPVLSGQLNLLLHMHTAALDDKGFFYTVKINSIFVMSLLKQEQRSTWSA
jgi:hypothetical protein